jgi:hypothetical protein
MLAQRPLFDPVPPIYSIRPSDGRILQEFAVRVALFALAAIGRESKDFCGGRN